MEGRAHAGASVAAPWAVPTGTRAEVGAVEETAQEAAAEKAASAEGAEVMVPQPKRRPAPNGQPPQPSTCHRTLRRSRHRPSPRHREASRCPTHSRSTALPARQEWNRRSRRATRCRRHRRRRRETTCRPHRPPPPPDHTGWRPAPQAPSTHWRGCLPPTPPGGGCRSSNRCHRHAPPHRHSHRCRLHPRQSRRHRQRRCPPAHRSCPSPASRRWRSTTNRCSRSPMSCRRDSRRRSFPRRKPRRPSQSKCSRCPRKATQTDQPQGTRSRRHPSGRTRRRRRRP